MADLKNLYAQGLVSDRAMENFKPFNPMAPGYSNPGGHERNPITPGQTAASDQKAGKTLTADQMIEGKPFKPAIQVEGKTYAAPSHLFAMEDAAKAAGTDAVSLADHPSLKYGWQQDGQFFHDQGYTSPWSPRDYTK